MRLLLGRNLPMGTPSQRIDNIRSGREWLVRLTRQDFGYDALKWHAHLWETDAGGYKWCRRSEEKWRRHAAEGAADPEWRALVKELEGRDSAT